MDLNFVFYFKGYIAFLLINASWSWHYAVAGSIYFVKTMWAWSQLYWCVILFVSDVFPRFGVRVITGFYKTSVSVLPSSTFWKGWYKFDARSSFNLIEFMKKATWTQSWLCGVSFDYKINFFDQHDFLDFLFDPVSFVWILILSASWGLSSDEKPHS